MIEERQFDAMVSGFYKAATGAMDWNDALTPVHDAFGTRKTILNSKDIHTGRLVQVLHSNKPAPDAGVLEYVRHWHQFDPRWNALLQQPHLALDRWWHCSNHFDDHFAAQDPFYQQFLVAQETRYTSITATMISESALAGFAVELPFSRGPLNVDEAHMLDRLSRHVFEALRMHEHLRQLAAQAVAGHGLLDAFAHPMWLLDASGFVFYANVAAKLLIERGDCAAINNRELRWFNSRLDRKVSELLHSLCRGEHGRRAVVDARLKTGDFPCWLHLHALSPLRVLGVFGDQPLVLATLFHPQHFKALDPLALGDLFGMTPTEAKVATLVADGLDAGQMATRLQVQISTIRTHLRQVFAKIGAQRMADAVRLLHQGDALWAQPSRNK